VVFDLAGDAANEDGAPGATDVDAQYRAGNRTHESTTLTKQCVLNQLTHDVSGGNVPFLNAGRVITWYPQAVVNTFLDSAPIRPSENNRH